MKTPLILVLSILLVIFIFSAGCIDNSQNSSKRFIIQLHTGDSLAISGEEVKNITEDRIQKVIGQGGYKFKNLSDNEYPYYYWFYTVDNASGRDVLSISIKSNNVTSLIKVLYSESFPESNLSEKKQWLKERVNEIATICNLTVNWTQVQWTVSYAD
jgi:hypothetical protein